MIDGTQRVKIGKRIIELSNLNKILYPEDGIIKAEVVEYYLKIAPVMLNHIKGRPLSFVRYPDGIDKEAFFQKNKPAWAPEWIEYTTLGSKEKKDYIIVSEEATLIWLANLACLEIHQIQSKKPDFTKPDYMVFDLDPPERYPFEAVAETAIKLKSHLENYGYHPFVKTSGGQGVHIFCPIEVEYDFHTVFKVAESIAKTFVAKNQFVTLNIKKNLRKGRIFIDIYRIRSSQSLISPYSLRGTKGAPVSTPVDWKTLEKLDDPHHYNIRNVTEIVKTHGDSWEAIRAYATELHTKRKPHSIRKTLAPNKKRKTPEQLELYKSKRNFDRSPEPEAEIKEGRNNLFVIHRHQASRLHYDLRLEKDGILKSWAVPKGMPPYPGIKRLAVQTEDHPIEYLNFEGKIPKGQYGGGDMWIFANGKYEITKEKKDGFYLRLYAHGIQGEYRIYNIKENNFLLERVDKPTYDWLHSEVQPMLAVLKKNLPSSDEYIYEIKWDGIRVIITFNEDNIKIRTRGGIDVTNRFPELLQSFHASCGILDGEIICLDKDGKPVFKDVIYRMQRSSETEIKRAAKRYPAYCYLFDCIYLDGKSLVTDPLLRRREFLKDIIKRGASYRMSEEFDDGEKLLEAVKQNKLEGIIAKRKNSAYSPGKRTDDWIKIKIRNTADVVIIGYTKGKGSRSKYFGSLHLGEFSEDGVLFYRGKVGTGFNSDLMKEVYGEIKKLKTVPRQIKNKLKDDKISVWVEPQLWCEIQYASITKDGVFREPVFVKLTKPD